MKFKIYVYYEGTEMIEFILDVTGGSEDAKNKLYSSSISEQNRAAEALVKASLEVAAVKIE